LDLLDNLIDNITAANTIYPISKFELEWRRHYQTEAITNCEQLLQRILCLENIIPIKASKFLPYVAQIEFEIKLLKGWRKSNNKLAAQVSAIEEREGKKERE
jgi:hypothetical protein